jgi:hypothetical protein
VQGYDGDTLWFNASKNELEGWVRDSRPDYSEYTRYKSAELPTDIETKIPVIEERMQVSKRVSIEEATIIKEPTTETRESRFQSPTKR